VYSKKEVVQRILTKKFTENDAIRKSMGLFKDFTSVREDNKNSSKGFQRAID